MRLATSPRGLGPAPAEATSPALPYAAIVGMGYVGLPTGVGFANAGFRVTGIDASEARIEHIRSGAPDISPAQRTKLDAALAGDNFALSVNPDSLAAADVVVICVPTPVDEALRPDLRFLRAACATVVEHARNGQTIVLTSTSYVGTTRDFLVKPLARRGLRVGKDVFVAFSPERIDPGNRRYEPDAMPRVVGGATEGCTHAAARFLGAIAASIHRVSSPEAAELTKLYENTFRAVNIAFANEMADASRAFGLDIAEVTDAAATKPYGFMPFAPGAGVGGHCIPCDPHYLLQGLRERNRPAPVIEHAMAAIAARPARVVQRAAELLDADGIELAASRVLVVGAAYKPGVEDIRESPSVEIMRELVECGADVAYHDPLVRAVALDDRLTLLSQPHPSAADYDLVIVVTLHPGRDCAWLADCERVLDCTYRTVRGRRRFVV